MNQGKPYRHPKPIWHNADMKSFLKDAWDALGSWIMCFAVAAIVVTVFFMAFDRMRASEESRLMNQVYPAWTKLHPDKQLTYEEWHVLYQKNLLPR